MFQFLSTATDPPSVIYMGRDKHENDLLVKHGYGEDDVWFHVDRHSSAHVYLRLIPGLRWDVLPTELLMDCAQLVKAHSIEGKMGFQCRGSKKNNIDVIYTPWSNLKKTQGMEVGEVSFHRQNQVKRFHVEKKNAAIVNRLQKTRTEHAIDYEGARLARKRGERASLRALQTAQKQAEMETARARAQAKRLESYEDVFGDKNAGPASVPSDMDAQRYEDEFFM